MTITKFNNKLYVSDETIESLQWARDGISKAANIYTFFVSPIIGGIAYIPFFGAVFEGYYTLNDASNIYDDIANKNFSRSTLSDMAKLVFHGGLTSLSAYSIATASASKLLYLTPAALILEHSYTTQKSAEIEISLYNNAIEKLILNGVSEAFTIEY